MCIYTYIYIYIHIIYIYIYIPDIPLNGDEATRGVYQGMLQPGAKRIVQRNLLVGLPTNTNKRPQILDKTG